MLLDLYGTLVDDDDAAEARGLDANSLDCSQLDHFGLISAAVLKERLEGLL